MMFFDMFLKSSLKFAECIIKFSRTSYLPFEASWKSHGIFLNFSRNLRASHRCSGSRLSLEVSWISSVFHPIRLWYSLTSSRSCKILFFSNLPVVRWSSLSLTLTKIFTEAILPPFVFRSFTIVGARVSAPPKQCIYCIERLPGGWKAYDRWFRRMFESSERSLKGFPNLI